MKIIVTSVGNNLDASMDPRFGRAPYFIIVDTETMEFDAVENAAVAATGGAGIQSAQWAADQGVGAVITGNVGPNALNVLKAAGIKVYQANAATVKESVEQFKKGVLNEISAPGPSHFGQGFGRGRV